MGINAPILAVCPTSEECTFHIIVGQEPTCELNRFNSALIHLIATCFIYDILGFSDKQPDPSSVVEIVTSLKRIDSTF